MDEAYLSRIANAIESIAKDIKKLRNELCEENGGQGVYIRGDVGVTEQ